MRVAQIEFVLDAAARLVLQFAVAIETIDQVPLGLNQRRFEFVAQFDQLFVTAVSIGAMLDVFESVAVTDAYRFYDGFWDLALGRQSIEPFDRRLDHTPSSLVLLVTLSLLLATPCMNKTERPSHRGQRQAFAD
jgi:hypothetical protein